MATGDAARPRDRDRILGLNRNLALRILSSVVILPLAGGFLVLGGAYFTVFAAFLAACMAWEWTRMVSADAGGVVAGLAAVLGALVVLSSLWLAADLVGVAILGAGAAVFGAAVARRASAPLWAGLASWVACIPCLAAVYLRGDEGGNGVILLVWLIVSVAATDTGAYVAGKSIGGPRLAPRISPNKTWAGLIGGMIASAAVGAICGWLVEGADPVLLLSGGAVIAVVGQIGDLMESSAKRRFGVKDSGNLIPGHGGVLDRLDGHMAVITAMAVLVLVSGQNPLIW